MNRELKGFMAKFDITYQNISVVLGYSINTIGNKIRNESFDQKEIKKLVEYFRNYDSLVTESIFFGK